MEPLTSEGCQSEEIENAQLSLAQDLEAVSREGAVLGSGEGFSGYCVFSVLKNAQARSRFQSIAETKYMDGSELAFSFYAALSLHPLCCHPRQGFFLGQQIQCGFTPPSTGRLAV